jgi:hypothetical protein
MDRRAGVHCVARNVNKWSVYRCGGYGNVGGAIGSTSPIILSEGSGDVDVRIYGGH